jgi:hypothetical protein
VTTARRLQPAALAVIVGSLLVFAGGVSTVTAAGVVEITTSTAAPSLDGGQAAMDQAVRAAVDTLLRETVGFTPALIVLTRAAVIGDRLYLRLLLADEEGARVFRDRAAPLHDAVPADPRGRDLQL